MNVYRGFEHKFTNAVAVVGSFDGVHKGHRMLIGLLNELSDDICGDSVIITFAPHPKQVFGGDIGLLTTIEERLYLLEQAGARNVVVVDFTREFAATVPDVFVRDYLVAKLGVTSVFTSTGHTFGRNRSGRSTEYAEFGVREVNVERLEEISSTQIRRLIHEGEMESASDLLTSAYLVFTPILEPDKLLPTSGNYQCVIDGQQRVVSVEELSTMKLKSRVLIKNRV